MAHDASATRSKIMRSIKSRNTLPEITVRKALFRAGFRFRIHYSRLPGKPDIVLPKHRAAIFVNGCFWHGHDCHIFSSPKSPDWREKIRRNRERDMANLSACQALGWRTLTVWECALQGKEKLSPMELSRTLESWVLYDPGSAEVKGRAHAP